MKALRWVSIAIGFLTVGVSIWYKNYEPYATVLRTVGGVIIALSFVFPQYLKAKHKKDESVLDD